MKEKLVSLIISTKNEKLNIKNLLLSIKKQTYKFIEIIVVDNNSIDETKEIAKKYTGLVFNKGPERSAQRNFGAKNAKGAYLLFLDADMILEKDVVRECVEIIQSLKIAGVIIPEKSIGKGFWGRVKAFERSFYVGDESIEAARFFEKKVFWEYGGYDENITGPEDWDISQKVKSKHKLKRIKSFIIHNEGESKLFDFIKKKYYYGKGSAAYIKNYPLRLTGTQVIYLLRPAFYKNWKRMIKRPILTCGIILLLALEQAAGFFGFLR